MVHAEYRGHTFVIVKALMTHKAESLYHAVFARVKELLPDSVKPDYVLSDYETALQNGLSFIFPDLCHRGMLVPLQSERLQKHVKDWPTESFQDKSGIQAMVGIMYGDSFVAYTRHRDSLVGAQR